MQVHVITNMPKFDTQRSVPSNSMQLLPISNIID